MNRLVKVIWKVALSLGAVLFLLWLLLQTSPVQTSIAKLAARKLENRLGGSVSFSKIHFRPFNALMINDLTVIDDNPATSPSGERADTILFARKAFASLSLRGMGKKGILLRRVTISDAMINLVNEEDGSNISRFLSGLKSDSKKEFQIRGDRISLDNIRFRMTDSRKDPGTKATGLVDFSDLDVTLSSFRADRISLKDGTFKANVQSLQASEKNGLSIEDISSKILLKDGKLEISDLEVKEGFSHFDAPSLTLEPSDEEGAGISETFLTASIEDSRIDARTLAWFIPSMQGKTLSVNLEKADIRGTLNDFSVDMLTFSEDHSGIRGSFEGNISGLPDLGSTRLDILAEGFRFNSAGIDRLVRQFVPGMKADLSRYAKNETLTFNGRGLGTLESMRVIGRVDAGEGSAEANLNIRGLNSTRNGLNISGNVSSDRLDLGSMAGIPQLGECSLRSGFNASTGSDGFKARIDSLFVDSFEALGYSYSNIRAAGTYSENAFDGRLVCNDPNLSFLFQGIFTLSDKTRNGLYKFYANVGYADLHALHFDKREVSKVSGQIDANYMTIKGKDLIGDLDVKNLVLEDATSRYDIGDICVKSHSNNKINRINITSDFLTGSFVGTKPLTSLLGDMADLTVSRDLPSLMKKKASTWKDDEYDVTLNVYDAQNVLSFFKPGLYVADSTNAVLAIRSDGEMTASLKSSRLAIGKNYLKGFNFSFDNTDGSMNAAATCQEVSAALFRMIGGTFTFFADEDRFSLGCTYDNHTREANKGEIHMAGAIERSDDDVLLMHGRTLPSSIWYNGERWTIPSSDIELDGRNIKISSLSANCGDQSVKVNGGISLSDRDTLTVDLSKMDISILGINSPKDLGLAGLASGKVILTSPLSSEMGLLMNVSSTGTEFGHCPVGTLLIGSSMDDKGTIHIVARNDLDGARNLDIRASYSTADKTLFGKAVLDQLNAGYLKPVLYKFVSDISGTANGQIELAVKDGQMSIRSKDCSLDNAMMRITYTNVPYWCSGPFTLDEHGVSFDGITIRDRRMGTASASGGLSWDHFKNATMNTRLTLNNMEAFNLSERDNQTFYGNVFASGTIDLTGPTNSMLMDINVRTDGDGNVHIPLDGNASASKNELLTFKEDETLKSKEDPYLKMLDNLGMGRKKSKDMVMKIRVDANRSTQAFVEIDRTAGNVLSGNGTGIIDMDIRPNRNLFSINGDYTISRGTFHFNAMDIAKRNFTISEGSTIRFNGDIMDSDLDISGLYSTKASLAALIADTSSVSTRRQVNCGIEVSGKLRDPQLDFTIDIPDLDPTTKTRVESALNTDDKVQKQMVALLLSGSFMPDEQSGIVNNSAALYTNVAEIMAGQLNTILQKLNIPLDFGLNYQSSESGYNIFDVAISTQLFNNKVIVNGAFGNREYSTSRAGDDMAGDLDIEIKLDKTGQVRLNLFSHSADDYTNYLDNTQRSGVGMSYQKEFDSFREFFNNLFRKKKGSEAADKKEEKKTIIIE